MSQKIDVLSKFPDAAQLGELYRRAGFELYLVGGIVRDIISMGARPIAVMDPLRFGAIDHPDTARVVGGVVAGGIEGGLENECG